MNVVDLLLRLRSLGVTVSGDGDRLRVSAPAAALTPALRAELGAAKPELLAFLRANAASEAEAIRPLTPGSRVPLSFTQQRFWFFHQLVPDTSAYHLCFGLRIEGAVDPGIVSRALDEIVRRHAVLRSVFSAADGQPEQQARPAAPLPLPLVDLSTVADNDRMQRFDAMAREVAGRPFDLEAGPPMRATLVRLADADHVLVVANHHIAFDGWSVSAFIREFGVLYEAFSSGRPSPLSELPVQYADFAAWQRSRQSLAAMDAQREYWKRQLGAAPTLQLPSDRTRPAFQTFRGGRAAFSLSSVLTDALDALARSERATLFMALLAGFYTLLQRYSGQTDLVVGTAIAGRPRPELEALIGPFINSLALRTDLSGDPTFRMVLGRARETALEAYAHQDLPFEQIVDDLHLDRALSRNPLFQVMLALQNVPTAPLALRDIRLSSFDIDRSTSVSDLELILWPIDRGLDGYVRYSAEIFDPPTIERLLAHYKGVLEAAVAAPDCRISELPLLTARERRQIEHWNDRRAEYATDQAVHEAFEAQARQTPDAPAIVCNGRAVSYREADARANALAHRLVAAGVAPEDRVAIFLERSSDFIVSALGIMKAGAAYLPIETTTPPDRLAYTLADAGARFVVAGPASARRVSDCGAVPLQVGEIPSADVSRPAVRVRAGNLAYVIYTSGSTGRPKGVALSHRSLQNLVAWHRRVYAVTSADRASLVAGLGFDASVWEVWPYLLSGACVHVPDEETRGSAASLLDWMAASEVSIAFVPTPLAEAMFDLPMPAQLRLRALLTGGDTLHRVPAALPFSVYNNYGPTENTVVASWTEVPGGTEQPPSIGKPVDNVRLHVLDARMSPVPAGVPGDLYIAGDSLARGYLGKPDLTADRFVPDPFAAEPGGRLYRTGDLVRRAPDGDLEFLGRLDDQVKVRGFRIELGEIESVLAQHPSVREAIVVARAGRAANRRLVAYAICRDGALDYAGVTRFLKAQLPDYMVPSAIVALDEFPVTPNGKIDRAALPEPAAKAEQWEETEPTSGAEYQLAEIWARVLRLDRVSRTENFFEIGGDSILALQVISAARQQGLRLTPRQVFEHPTVAELAAVAVTETAPVVTDRADGLVPLTPIQRWFLDANAPEPHHFNQSVMLAARARLDTAVLQRALDRLVEHHDALRLRFTRADAAWQQTYAAPGPPTPLDIVDLTPIAAVDRAAAAVAAAGRIQASLNLESGPLFRAALFERGPDEPQRLLLAAHHLVVDTVSWRILLEDLQQVYIALASGRDAVLPAKSTSFRVWAERLEAYAASSRADAERDYWQKTADHEVRLPLDFHDGENLFGTADAVTVSATAADTESLLREVPRTYGMQVHEVLLAALAKAVAAWTGERRLTFSLESHGRDALFDDLDLSRTVGWFTSLHPLSLDLAGADDPGSLLKRVKEQVRAVPNRGIGFGLLRYGRSDDGSRASLASAVTPAVSFNYLGQFGASEASAVFAPVAEPTGAVNSPRMRRPHELEASALVAGGELTLTLHFSNALHRKATIAALARATLESLSTLIAHCRTPQAGGFTPSDFPEANVSQDDLDRLLEQLGQAGSYS